MMLVRCTLFVLCAAFLLIGCTTSHRPAVATAETRNSIYERNKTEFERAAYYKPSAEWTDEPGRQLAPLLFVETNNDRKAPGLAANALTLYFQKGETTIQGKQKQFVTFLWFHQTIPQGVRIILNSNGHPAIWEVLNDSRGVKQIFVSESLEQLASKEFSTTYPGRRSLLERPVTDTPNVVVSRVISDGPMTMGPAIYLRANTFDVSTLICRCMPPQAKEVSEPHEYQVLDLSDSSTMRAVQKALKESKSPVEAWLQQGSETLETVLRLPSNF